MTKLQDLREKRTYISPAEGMIPEGVRNTIMNVQTISGESVGDFEIGTDGFVQAIFKVADYLVRLEVYPDGDHAYLRVME